MESELESEVALDVLHGRSNVARKNAILARIKFGDKKEMASDFKY